MVKVAITKTVTYYVELPKKVKIEDLEEGNVNWWINDDELVIDDDKMIRIEVQDTNEEITIEEDV